MSKTSSLHAVFRKSVLENIQDFTFILLHHTWYVKRMFHTFVKRTDLNYCLQCGMAKKFHNISTWPNQSLELQQCRSKKGEKTYANLQHHSMCDVHYCHAHLSPNLQPWLIHWPLPSSSSMYSDSAKKQEHAHRWDQNAHIGWSEEFPIRILYIIN